MKTASKSVTLRLFGGMDELGRFDFGMVQAFSKPLGLSGIHTVSDLPWQDKEHEERYKTLSKTLNKPLYAYATSPVAIMLRPEMNALHVLCLAARAASLFAHKLGDHYETMTIGDGVIRFGILKRVPLRVMRRNIRTGKVKFRTMTIIDGVHHLPKHDRTM